MPQLTFGRRATNKKNKKGLAGASFPRLTTGRIPRLGEMSGRKTHDARMNEWPKRPRRLKAHSKRSVEETPPMVSLSRLSVECPQISLNCLQSKTHITSRDMVTCPFLRRKERCESYWRECIQRFNHRRLRSAIFV